MKLFLKNDKISADGNNTFINIYREYLSFNHYNCQSLEFWNNIKCTRGDSDHYLSRTQEDFHAYDVNDVEDLELYNQNLVLYENELIIQT